ncbi:MAG: hypothetical protein LBE22_07630 [Azoarcus sp.]|jgi:hypothetical protein|nr:hypothetical protein [Azoarcus sp.]
MSQYEKTHATTVIAAADLLPNRFVALNGNYAPATSTGGLTDVVGVTESEARQDEAVSVVTGYSYLVELGATVTIGAYLKPGTNGLAAIGAADDRCAIAMEAGAAGDVIEARLLQHLHS